MVAPSSAGGRFRQRKISTKQTLQILKQSQISDVDNEDLQQRELQEIETGVDKAEEDEVHLQKILKKTGLTHTADTYIPTPDASKEWLEAGKYYKGEFHSPDSYIKSSSQLEDYSGVLYNMDERDEEFLKSFNEQLTKTQKTPKKKTTTTSPTTSTTASASDTDKLTEDEFELMMHNFEKTINEKQPFLVTDPSHILSLDEIKLALLQVDRSSVENLTQLLSEELDIHPFITQFDAKLPSKPRALKTLIEQYGPEIYEHFKSRKIERGGKSVTPILKFTGDDDNDAYICFRQRQFRQQRKTRRADVQSSEKLVKLYKELKATKELALMVAQREQHRLRSLKAESEIFEYRCKVKTLKRELGITDSDEDLIAHKKKKLPPPPPQEIPVVEVKDERKKGLTKTSNNANVIEKSKVVEVAPSDTPQQFQPYVKLPPSKIPDMELETVEFLLSNKDRSVQRYVEEKMKKRKLQDVGFVNVTDDPNIPFLNINAPYAEVVNSQHLPYSSIATSLFDVNALGYVPKIDKFIHKGQTQHDGDILVFNPETNKFVKKFQPERFNPLFDKKTLTSDTVMTLRKRVGRLGQTYVDRRGMMKDVMPSQSLDRDDFSDDESFDAYERMKDQWKFDSDVDDQIDLEPFSDDPSKLNSISNDTQTIRFGCMLLAKAYDSLKEAMLQQRQQLYLKLHRIQQQRQLQMQQQQQQQESQKNNGSSSNNTSLTNAVNGGSIPDSIAAPATSTNATAT